MNNSLIVKNRKLKHLKMHLGVNMQLVKKLYIGWTNLILQNVLMEINKYTAWKNATPLCTEFIGTRV